MNALSEYLNWVGSAEDGLIERSSPSVVGIEPLLEQMLWHLTTSFFKGPFIQAEQPLRQPDSAIQYFSFPLYSHFKEISRNEPYWLSRYPIFFGQRDHSQLVRVITQYAFLYSGLKENRPPFSLTSFAGNIRSGLSHPPRYIVFDLKPNPTATDARGVLTPGKHVFFLDAYLPSPPDISAKLRNVPFDVIGRFDVGPYPVIGRQFNENNATSFWASFDEIVNVCSGLREAVEMVEQYADRVEAGIYEEVENKIELREQERESVQSTAKGLARFVGWNYALGFRKIIYCPFRIAEPFGQGLVSWGGGILVLSDSVPLTTILESLDVKTVSQPSGTNPADEQLSQLVAAIRFFIDVATPKVILGDWKYYQRRLERTTINIEQAEGISEGLRHELKGLHTIVYSYVKDNKRQELIPLLETSERMARLVYLAYTKQEDVLSLPELMRELNSILQWKTVRITDNGVSSQNPNVDVAFPLLYVISELCRNAVKFSPGNPIKDNREVLIDFVIEDDQLTEVHVMNQTNNNDFTIDCRTREMTQPPRILGLYQVMNFVCDIFKGEFSFQIAQGRATASVKLKKYSQFHAVREPTHSSIN
jgi:signal transduction histidine kinase